MSKNTPARRLKRYEELTPDEAKQMRDITREWQQATRDAELRHRDRLFDITQARSRAFADAGLYVDDAGEDEQENEER